MRSQQLSPHWKTFETRPGSKVQVLNKARMGRVLLVALLLFGLARAEDPGVSFLAVLDPESGRVLGHYRLDEELQQEVLDGVEAPHFPYSRRFCGHEKKVYIVGFEDEDAATKPYGGKWQIGQAVTGRGLLSDGTQFAFRADAGYEGPGMFGLIRNDRFHPLVRTEFHSSGRSLAAHKPRLTVAGPYLFTDSTEGVTCMKWADGSTLWKAPWHFAHCRYPWGAFYQRGCVFADLEGGLARIDPAGGKVLWKWAGAGEVENLRIYDDGRLYIGYVYAPRQLGQELRQASQERYGAKVTWAAWVPYRDLYFGSTQQQGRWAIWERVNGRWSFVLDHPGGISEAELDTLYARHQLSPTMRRRLLKLP